MEDLSAAARSVAPLSSTGVAPATLTNLASFDVRATDAVLDVLTLATAIAAKPKDTAFSVIRLTAARARA
jgi:hypothetical protein